MKNNANALLIRRLTYAALCLALALVLPFLTGQIPEIGNMLCPMHIPVLLCGFACGWPYGLMIGLVAPLLRFALFGMPPIYPTAIAMAFELATYGAVSGLLYKLLPKTLWAVYAALGTAMVAGRAVWGLAQYLLLSAQGKPFTATMFVAGAITSAIPGLILQLVLIPAVVMVLRKAKLGLNE